MDDAENLFTQFAATIGSHAGATYLDSHLQDHLRLHRNGTLEVLYAPFDYVQPAAKLVIVGITPGRVQAENALTAARSSIRGGKSLEEAARLAKSVGSFSGSMRKNLIAMLDHIGLNTCLGISSCDDMFEPGSDAVHFTSALRYPVFVNGKNYNGQPDFMKTPALLNMVERYLAAEAAVLPDAVWLPLGPKPSAAVRHLVKKGLISTNRVLDDLPHPSGANAERIAYFLGRKGAQALSGKTRPEKLDDARERLTAQIQQMTRVR